MRLPSISWKLFVLVIVVFLIGSLPSVYFYIQYSQTKKLLSDPSAANRANIAATIASVGKLMKLPENEEPSVATITNKEQLQSEPFFQTAENGDTVIIYRNARKAILYRPSTNKIIDVVPITVNSPTPTAAAEEDPVLDTPPPAEATTSAFP